MKNIPNYNLSAGHVQYGAVAWNIMMYNSTAQKDISSSTLNLSRCGKVKSSNLAQSIFQERVVLTWRLLVKHFMFSWNKSTILFSIDMNLIVFYRARSRNNTRLDRKHCIHCFCPQPISMLYKPTSSCELFAIRAGWFFKILHKGQNLQLIHTMGSFFTNN